MPFLKSGHEKIFYQITEGKVNHSNYDAVIFLHSLGTDHRMWRYQVEALIDHVPKIVTLDTRGHGKSTAQTRVSSDQWTEDIKNLCDDLKLEKVVLCGVSMGGVQSLAFALEHPEVTAGLVLADTFAKIEPDPVETKVNLTAGVAKEQGMKKYAHTYLDQTLSNSNTAVDIREDLYAAIAGISVDDYHQAAEACFSADFKKQLKTIHVPTLVLIGEEDLKTPMSLSEVIHKNIPNSILKTVPNAMHLSNVDNPHQFNQFVKDFLKLV
jgi:3-oxoadipate enol-lactonase